MSLPATLRPSLSARLLAVPLLAALAACTSTPADGGDTRTGDRMITDGQQFPMQPGDSVTLADHSQLRYLRVVNDSRCPPDVQCVWAGNAELAFEWQATGSGGEQFSLNTTVGDTSHVLGERRLTLVSVARGDAPEAQLRIERQP